MTIAFKTQSKTSIWPTLVVAALAFWLSGSLLLDTVLMPVLYTSGMMVEPGFATTGYAIFWIFNRVELLCAALVLTGALALYLTQAKAGKSRQQPILLAFLLLGVTLIFTYGLSPQMSALGLQLNLFNPLVDTPASMNSLHLSYWLLEVLKLVAGGLLLKLVYRAPVEVV